MKKLIALIGLVFTLAIVTGCSHNVLTYSDGIGFETTMKPDSGNFGVVFRYGKILSVVARENTETEMFGTMEGNIDDQAIAGAKVDGKVRFKTGAQTTGYDKDIVKTLDGNPDAIAAFYEGKSLMIQGAAINNDEAELDATVKETLQVETPRLE